MLSVAGFIATAMVIVLAGVTLARNGDLIAARTRLGGLWMGTLFLAGATSLPELSTDIAAVRLGATDLAAGDLFGSSMANMLILALVSLMPGRELFRKAALDNVLAAALAIVLTAIAAVLLLLRPGVAVLGIGVGSLVLAITYLFGARVLYQHSATLTRAARQTEMAAAERNDQPIARAQDASHPLRRAILHFVGAALIILIVAPFFAASAKSLAGLTGLSTTFVGTWLVGISTSLPELVTSIAAVRLKAYDLAVGNLFGSNAFNMLMFLPLDLAQSKAPILSVVSAVHALSALTAIVLMGIALAAIVYRATGRLRLIEPSGWLMLLAYGIGLGLLLTQTRGR